MCLLYRFVTGFGGFREVVADRKWSEPKITKLFSNARKVYEKFLFRFEKTYFEKTKFSLSFEKDKVKLEDVDPCLMKEVKVFDIKSRSELTKEVIKQILLEDVVIVRNFSWAVGINSGKFDPELLRK